jgi:hypothetical protein
VAGPLNSDLAKDYQTQTLSGWWSMIDCNSASGRGTAPHGEEFRWLPTANF